MRWLWLSLVVLFSCGIDAAPDGARRTPPGTGPRIVFDTTRRPLPEIPQPNDVATFADPTSRTGRRINVSQISPTRLEDNARQGFAELEGWGTFAPITIAFESLLDLDDIASRTANSDPSDDPFYLVDLTTGVPVPLDMGKGSFPLALVDRDRYWPNDPRHDSDTVLFETQEEGSGPYRAALDTDFDGVLDHPNVLHPNGNARIEDVLSWYERETNTLILRSVVPLEEMHEYAVVMTDRLHGAGGAVRSPFEFVHHPSQQRGAERLRDILNDGGRANYYGDLAGSGLARVAFTWTFTTQPVFDDMRVLRNGLHGVGPFAHLATEFPAKATLLKSIGFAVDPADETPGAVDSDPRCAPFRGTPYIVKLDPAKDSVKQLLQTALGLQGPELDRLLAILVENVDHLVVGTYESPYFMGDPAHEDPDGRFQLDFKNGTGRVGRDTVPFWIAVPKNTAQHKQPFPVTVWAHGTTLHADEIVVRAGYWAKQGVAMMGIDMPGHGLYVGPGLETAASVFLKTTCMVRWVKALATGRHHDLNGDGVPDSGGLLWSAHLFHSRDNIRQAVVDEMGATRLLRSFDGVARGEDTNNDGTADLAGDFDGDGVVDVGGPGVTLSTAGNSFGGVLAMVHGAVDPEITVAAPISGGGGLKDVATRSSLVPDSVLEQVFTPLLVAVPPGKDSVCTGDQRSIRFVVNDLIDSREVEVACLSPSELAENKTVVLYNLRNGEKRCARTGDGGLFRIAIPANAGDRLDVQVYDAPDVVGTYGKICDVRDDAPVGRRLNTVEVGARSFKDVADTTKTCDAAVAATGLDENRGCAQYRDSFFPVGSDLVAPQEGLGLVRGTPDARRLFDLIQGAIDPGDPVNFAPYYALRPNPGYDGTPLPPRAIVSFGTAGDPSVPIASSYAFMRAAGAVPFLPPSMAATHPEWAQYATPQKLWDQLGAKSPQDVLVSSSTLEGIARLGRTRSGPACKVNYVQSTTCPNPPSASDCSQSVFDPDWLSEGANLWDAPHLPTPLRLARVAYGDVERRWMPRTTSVPFGTDDQGYTGSEPLLGVVDAWIQPQGQHVFVLGEPCKAFDDTSYYNNLVARFIATKGTDLFFLSHPATHRCLVNESCEIFR